MAYKTLKKVRILRYGRGIEVDKDYVFTKKEEDECPNMKAWVRWGLVKEVPDSKKKQQSSKKKQQRKKPSAKRSTKPTRKSKVSKPTSAANTDTKPEDTTKIK